MSPLIFPVWDAPAGVMAYSSTRRGGVSRPPYDSLNLGTHVGDEPDDVAENRRLLAGMAALPAQPCWLEQIHGTRVVTLDGLPVADTRADAVYTRLAGQVCAVMTADCLPVLFASRRGDEVAAAHAGWRGLCDGVLEQTVSCFSALPEEIVAWLGPAIGPTAFEVGAEVRAGFVHRDPQAAQAFVPRGDKYLADIYLLARQRLRALGVHSISGGEYCTVSQPQDFFSYRRERVTGRMASFIWIK